MISKTSLNHVGYPTTPKSFSSSAESMLERPRLEDFLRVNGVILSSGAKQFGFRVGSSSGLSWIPSGSSSGSTSIGLVHRDVCAAPSTQASSPTPTSLTFFPPMVQSNGPRLPTLAGVLSENPGPFPLDLVSPVLLPGNAASIFGSEGKNSGSICLESRNSPRASGGLAGSQEDLPWRRSKSMSTPIWAARASGILSNECKLGGAPPSEEIRLSRSLSTI